MATSDEFTIAAADGVQLRITGFAKTMRAMSKAGADAEDMRDLMHTIGMLVVNAASPPKVSGDLAATLRAGRGKTKAVVRAGTARVPYAGPIHYGWPARNIRPQPFLINALNAQRSAVFTALENGLGDILRKNDLT